MAVATSFCLSLVICSCHSNAARCGQGCHDSSPAGREAPQPQPIPPAGLTRDSPLPAEPLPPPHLSCRRKKAPCRYHRKASFNCSFPIPNTRGVFVHVVYFFFFKPQLTKMHSSSSVGLEKAKHRCCQESSEGRQPFCSQTAGGSQTHPLPTVPTQSRFFLFLSSSAPVSHEKQKKPHKPKNAGGSALHPVFGTSRGRRCLEGGARRLGRRTSTCSLSLELPVAAWKENPQSCFSFLFLGRRHRRPRPGSSQQGKEPRNGEGGTRRSAVSCPSLVLAQGTHHKAKKPPFVCSGAQHH